MHWIVAHGVETARYLLLRVFSESWINVFVVVFAIGSMVARRTWAANGG